MNILMCLSRMGIGGAESHVLTLSVCLKKEGHSVTVISSGGALVERLETGGIRHITLPLDRKDPAALIKNRDGIASAVKELRPDVIHAHGRIPAFVCGMLKSIPGFPPVVTTAHGFWDPRAPKGPLSYWGDHTIAVSDELSGWLQEKYRLLPDNITVIPNGVEVPEECEAAPGRDILELSAVCRLDRDNLKGIMLLCDTVVILNKANQKKTAGQNRPVPQLRLRIYGDGSEKDTIIKYISAYPEKEDGNRSILLSGPVTDPSEALSASDIFIGSSRSALEAAAAGIPVILLSGSGNCGGILSALNAEDAERTNFVPDESYPAVKETGSPGLLCTSLSRLAESKELREKAGEYAKKRVSKTHDIKDTSKKTEEIYKNVIRRKRPAVLLCGYFGAGNAGDDATLDAAVKTLMCTGVSGNCIYAVSRRRGFDSVKKAGASPVGRFDLFKLGRLLRKTRLFILCGGSLLQDLTSRRSLLYYSNLSKAAVRNGCKSMLLGSGLGPLNNQSSLKRAAEVLKAADRAGFRDVASLELAKKLTGAGKAPGALYLSADAALEPVCEGLPKADTPEERYIVIAPRSIPGYSRREQRAWAGRAAAAAAALCAAAGLRAVAAASAPEDETAAKYIAAACGGRYAGILGPTELKELLSGAELSVCVRLHAAVFSASVGCPALCICYDPKVKAFAETAGYPSITPEELSDDLLISAYNDRSSREDVLNKAREIAAGKSRDFDSVKHLFDL